MLRYLLIVFFVIGNLPQFLWGQISSIEIENQEDYYFRDVFFLNETVGFLVGSDFTTGNLESLVLRTVDGGNTWTPVPLGDDVPRFHSIFFVNEQVGYIGAEEGWVYKTTDGGNNFFYLSKAPISYSDLIDVHFASEDKGFFTIGGGGIFKTDDGAETFSRAYDDSRFFNKIQFVGENTGYALGFELTNSFHDGAMRNSVLLKTTNQGDNWNIVADSMEYKLRSFHFLDESTAFACSYNNEIYKSSNGGQSWEIVSTSDDQCNSKLLDITFFNNQVGYAVGGYKGWCQQTKKAIVWETKNGGESWERILELEDEEYFRKITRISDTKGLITMQGGDVYLINTDEITTVKALEAKPNIALQLSPNPFQNDFQLQFELQKPSITNIELYNIEGQRQNILSKKRLEAGLQSFEIKPSFSSTSNIYFIEVTINGNKHTEKVIRYK